MTGSAYDRERDRGFWLFAALLTLSLAGLAWLSTTGPVGHVLPWLHATASRVGLAPSNWPYPGGITLAAMSVLGGFSPRARRLIGDTTLTLTFVCLQGLVTLLEALNRRRGAATLVLLILMAASLGVLRSVAERAQRDAVLEQEQGAWLKETHRLLCEHSVSTSTLAAYGTQHKLQPDDGFSAIARNVDDTLAAIAAEAELDAGLTVRLHTILDGTLAHLPTPITELDRETAALIRLLRVRVLLDDAGDDCSRIAPLNEAYAELHRVQRPTNANGPVAKKLVDDFNNAEASLYVCGAQRTLAQRTRVPWCDSANECAQEALKLFRQLDTSGCGYAAIRANNNILDLLVKLAAHGTPQPGAEPEIRRRLERLEHCVSAPDFPSVTLVTIAQATAQLGDGEKTVGCRTRLAYQFVPDPNAWDLAPYCTVMERPETAQGFASGFACVPGGNELLGRIRAACAHGAPP